MKNTSETTGNKDKPRSSGSLFKRLVMWLNSVLKTKIKHDFDLTEKMEIHTDTWQRGNDGELHEIIVGGFKCKKCQKILWLKRSQITDLPRSMSYCK